MYSVHHHFPDYVILLVKAHWNLTGNHFFHISFPLSLSCPYLHPSFLLYSFPSPFIYLFSNHSFLSSILTLICITLKQCHIFISFEVFAIVQIVIFQVVMLCNCILLYTLWITDCSIKWTVNKSQVQWMAVGQSFDSWQGHGQGCFCSPHPDQLCSLHSRLSHVHQGLLCQREKLATLQMLPRLWRMQNCLYTPILLHGMPLGYGNRFNLV